MRTTKLVSVMIAGLVVACVFAPRCSAAPEEDDAAENYLEAQQASESQPAGGTPGAGGGTPEEGGGAAESSSSEAAASSDSPTEGSEGEHSESEEGGAEEGSASASSSQPSAEEESEEAFLANNTDIKNSLAEYLFDVLTGADNDNNNNDNDDNKQQGGEGEGGEGASPASSDSGQSPAAASSQSESAGGEGASQSQSQTPQNGGSASPAQGSSTEGEGSPSTTDEVIDCSKEVDLLDFCEFTPAALRDFMDDVTVKGLREAFMDMQIVEDLKSCRRGEWCLGNKLETLMALEDKKFQYPSPLCQDGMWECLFKAMLRRQSCDTDSDKEFMFVVDALDLLCSMSGVDAYDVGQEPTEREGSCIAHVHAALSVSYADFLASGLQEYPMSEEVSCEGDAFRMSETFLCAEDSCKGQFESRTAMGNFRRWGWFLDSLEQRVNSCPSLKNDTCGVLHLPIDSQPQESPPHQQPTSEWYDYDSTTWSTPSWFSLSSTPSYYEQSPEAGSVGTSGVFDKGDETMAIALTVSTSMVLVVMLLGVFFYWRRRRANTYYYRAVADGYDKVPSDEARLLGRSSSD